LAEKLAILNKVQSERITVCQWGSASIGALIRLYAYREGLELLLKYAFYDNGFVLSAWLSLPILFFLF
jgi:hypothetical protein